MNHRPSFAMALMLAAGAAPSAATELRDPTRPPVTAAVVHGAKHVDAPRVSAIFTSAARRVAIFDSQPVHEGDRVGAYFIETITAAGVRYRLGKQLAFAPLTAVADAAPTPPRNP